MNPSYFVEVYIPCPLLGSRTPNYMNDYFELLEKKVFLAVDAMLLGGLIDSWHFLTHAALDLRLCPKDPSLHPKIQDILRTHQLPTGLVPWPQTGPNAVVNQEFLQKCSEITRTLLRHTEREEQFQLIQHYLCNMHGLGNEEEATLKFNQAVGGWIVIKRDGEGMPENQAISEAKRIVKEMAQRL